jgi:hypothetical protein
VQVDPIKFVLKAPSSERLKLEYDEPPSNFNFKLNLRHYSMEKIYAAAAKFVDGA